MKPLKAVPKNQVVALATATAALGLPPTTFGLVPSWWNEREVVPEVELEIWADAAVALTAALLYGAALHALTFADITLTSVAHLTGVLTKNAHGLKTGDGPVNLVSDTTQPGGTDATTPYWWITVSANTGKIAASFEDAMTGVAVPLSSDGAGVIKIHATVDTDRVYWQVHGDMLGVAGDGAVALDVQKGYRKRMVHSPRVVAYALVGTADGNLSAAIVPVQDANG